MDENHFKREKISVVLLNIICKIMGIAMICLYVKEKVTIFLPIGALTFFISSFGSVGAYFEWRCLLHTYCVLLLSFLCSQFIMVTTFQTDLHKFFITEWIVLSATVLLEIAAVILAFRLNKKLQGNNGYEQF